MKRYFDTFASATPFADAARALEEDRRFWQDTHSVGTVTGEEPPAASYYLGNLEAQRRILESEARPSSDPVGAERRAGGIAVLNTLRLPA